MPKHARGIDVSYWQDGPDDTLIDAEAIIEEPPDFFLFRTGDGVDLDPEADHHFHLASRLEAEHTTPWGVYHYIRGRQSTEDQLFVILDVLDGDFPPLGVWIDVEGSPDVETPRGRARTRDERRHLGSYLPADEPAGADPRPPLTVATVLSRVLELRGELVDRGIYGGIYGNWGLRPLARDARHVELADDALWIPDYAAKTGDPGGRRLTRHGWREPGLPAPWTTWTIHQVTGRGEWSGVEGAVDIDVWNGTVADLDAWVETREDAAADPAKLTPAQRLASLEARVARLEGRQA